MIPIETTFTVHNTTEDLVELYLDDCIRQAGACSCARCRADIKALALNELPTKYVATKVGNTYVRMNAMGTQSQADIITAIISAARVVREHPNH